MSFDVLPIEIEALRKLERTTRRAASQLTTPQERNEHMAMANLLGSVLDRAEFSFLLKGARVDV